MSKTRRTVVISLFCCLSVVFDIIKEFIPFLNLPSGGSINISLIPIFVGCFVLGVKDGMIISILSYIVSTIFGLNSIFLSIPQYTLDYLVPTICVGLSSIFYKNKNIVEMESGIIISMILRTTSIIISGAVYWLDSTSVAGSREAVVGSLVYNGPYALATLIVLLLTVPLITKLVNKYLI